MDVRAKEAKRCVVWFGAPSQSEKEHLLQQGWLLRVVPPGSCAGLGLRYNDLVVAVVEPCAHRAKELNAVEQLFAEHHHLPVLVLASGDDPGAPPLKCRQAIPTPRDPAAISRQLDHAITHTGQHHANASDELLGDSPAMDELRATLVKYATVELPVLITGQTGTGKELAAHALHRHSSRHQRPFRAINCGAIPVALVQSELFGHERGAFTGAVARRQGLFESADGGTVLLDEIGDLPLDAQTSLLRVLQEGTIERVGGNQSVSVDVRVIAATHVNLEQAVAQGRFRQDLYYRLNVLRLSIPALHEREGDVLMLASHFLEVFRRQYPVRARGFTRAARIAMERFAWPGNVRELLNRVQRAAITTETELIDCDAMELGDAAAPSNGSPLRAIAMARTQLERDTLMTCLKKTRYNISACARLMQVSRVTIYRMCRKHQVQPHALR